MSEPLYRIAWIPLSTDMCSRTRINNLEAVDKIGGYFIDCPFTVGEAQVNENVLTEKLAKHICNQLNNETYGSVGGYVVVPNIHRDDN